MEVVTVVSTVLVAVVDCVELTVDTAVVVPVDVTEDVTEDVTVVVGDVKKQLKLPVLKWYNISFTYPSMVEQSSSVDVSTAM
jgi:hypothetical protein